jgi:hypothetical protein
MTNVAEEYLTTEHLDTYIELIFAMMCIRHPALHDQILKFVPGVGIASSCIVKGQKQDLLIPSKGIIADFKKEGLTNVQSIKKSSYQVNSMFLISMWAILSETSIFKDINKEPIVQFFRHVRNGCAHGNKFNFKHLEYPAEWRDKCIKQENTGKPVFPNILKDGDPILLLVDINNRYFKNVKLPGYIEFS